MIKTQVKLPGMDNYFLKESMSVLRTNIQFCGQDVKVIALTSCDQNEGKTYLSLHLAYSLAELGKRVLLIDADMRKSVLAGRYTDAMNAKGLSEVLSGQEKLGNCIYTTQYNNLSIMFAGQVPPNPVELINAQYFKRLIDASRVVYDYVIVDTPPLGLVIDAAVIAAQCDSSILVIGNDHTKYSKAREVVDQLKKSGCNVLGVIRNNVAGKNTGYYYKKS